MARGAGARKRRSARRGQTRRAVQPGVGKAPVQIPSLVASVEEARETPREPVEVDVAAQESACRAWAEAQAHEELGPDANPAVFAVCTAKYAQQFAAMTPCSSCTHAFAAHLGTNGPCTMDDCSCESYAGAEVAEDKSDDTATTAAEPLGVITHTVTAANEPNGGVTFSLSEGSFEPAGTASTGDERVSLLLENFSLTLPVEKAEVMPGEAPMIEGPTGPVHWSAIFAPEGKLTSDGRAFAPGSIGWRELPLTLMAMIETTEGGHIGAQVCGRIDKIWRDEAAGLIRAQGVFDSGEYGTKIAGLVNDQTLRGVSVDLAIYNYLSGPRSDWFTEDGTWEPKPESEGGEAPSLLDILFDGAGDEPMISVVTKAEIGMTTVCPFPAFAEAKIVPGDSLVAAACDAIWTVTGQGGWTVTEGKEDALTASATVAEAAPAEAVEDAEDVLTASAAGLAPEVPPSDWFSDPELTEPTGIIVDDDGRIRGHAALWDSCHIGFPGTCKSPPASASGYAYFHLGEVVCEEGVRRACGQVTLDAPHAGPTLGRADATRHYDHTGTAVADVVCGEDEYGIWVAGAMRGDIDADTARALRGAKLSGDWRRVNDSLELVALLCVNVPGFPVPRARSLTASVGGVEEVMSLTAAGIPIFESDLNAEEQLRLAELRAEFEAVAS